MMRHLFSALLLLSAVAANAQDVLSVGSGQAAPGGSVAIPVSVRDTSGTPVGLDAGSGNRIQSIAFKVLFPIETVASVTFTRAGVTSGLTPLVSLSPSGSGFVSAIFSFSESTSPIPFTLNQTDPIGTLTVNLQPSAVRGTTALLTLHPDSAMLANQGGTLSETVMNGNLALINGSVTVTSTLGTPAGFVATASGTTQVNASWGAVSGADHYEVWRSSHGGASAPIATPSGTTFSDTSVVAGVTYLYRVRAIDAGGAASAFSNLDPATTIVFTDDPLASGTAIKAIHFIEARTAVNAMRDAAGQLPVAADATIAVGLPVKAQHMTDLRTMLNAARVAAGLSALSFTDPTITQFVTPVKAVHIQEVRNGVK